MTAFNTFRLLGDLCHVISFFMLFYRLYRSKNATGISVKTQELYLLVFVSRYLDLFTNHISTYNTIMKILYLGSAAGLVYLLHFVPSYKRTREGDDSFRHWEFAVAPCLLLALIFNERFTLLEILWSFSTFLEAIAILPQIIILQRYGLVENLTSNYVFFLGAYRALYVINWVYRYATEPHYWHPLVWVTGAVQVMLFIDFFYYYIIAKVKNQEMKLPQ